MSDTDRQMMPEKQVKIYLAVLAVLLVVAVGVTVFTAYQDEKIAKQEEPETAVDSEITAEESQETKPVQHNFLDANSRIEETSDVKPEESSAPEISEAPETEGEAEVEEEAAEPQTQVEAFDPETDLMVWPVSGTVLMDFSPDALIYDATLDLYRTNDSISIGAAEEENVVAAAAGIVEKIGESDELGHYVVLNNGNGYETTYGQLSEETIVEVGEPIAQGETIGRISEPSWYSSALGTHLTFTVTVNGEQVNPLDYLENTLDD